LPIVLTTVGTIILFSTFDLHINKSFIYLLFCIASFITVKKFIKKVSEGIEEIQISGDSYKLYFFNKNKDAITIKKLETVISIDEEIVAFKDKITGKLIGAAKKKAIEEPERWPRLIKLLGNEHSPNS
jgi:hypothetical protein